MKGLELSLFSVGKLVVLLLLFWNGLENGLFYRDYANGFEVWFDDWLIFAKGLLEISVVLVPIGLLDESFNFKPKGLLVTFLSSLTADLSLKSF